MTLAPPDGTRDRRIEDFTNLWVIHPAARALLPLALRWRVSANTVSLAGLALGIVAAIAYWHWASPAWATLGFIVAIGWLIADGLDGIVARATGTSSAFGRFLDGLCDHGVFTLIYVAMALSIGTIEGWMLAVAAGLGHMVQSNIYEGERARFHRRLRGDAGEVPPPSAGKLLERLYDGFAGGLDRLARPFDRALGASGDPVAIGRAYVERAAPVLRMMMPLSANTRVIVIWLACLAGNPRIFWWFEIVPLTLIAAAGLFGLRRIESGLLGRSLSHSIHLKEPGNT